MRFAIFISAVYIVKAINPTLADSLGPTFGMLIGVFFLWDILELLDLVMKMRW